MSWALIGIVGGLTVAIAVLASAGWWFGKRGFDAMDRYVAEADNAIELQAELVAATQAQERTIETLKHVQADRDRQAKVNLVLKSQLEDAATQLRVAGNADAAGSIRAALGRLRDLAEEVPEVPEAAPTDDS
jgi:hypothetical protein